MDSTDLTEVSSNKSEILLVAIERAFIEKSLYISKINNSILNLSIVCSKAVPCYEVLLY